MELGFQFSVRWSDNDLIEVRISAWNGAFGGSADVYIGIGELEKTAARLQGFPSSPSDVREFTFGTFDPKIAGGGVNMRFFCADRSGHARVEAMIESKPNRRDIIQSAHLSLPIEAAALDTFVEELRQMGMSREGNARLRGMS